jgi:hypothetical protein
VLLMPCLNDVRTCQAKESVSSPGSLRMLRVIVVIQWYCLVILLNRGGGESERFSFRFFGDTASLNLKLNDCSAFFRDYVMPSEVRWPANQAMPSAYPSVCSASEGSNLLSACSLLFGDYQKSDDAQRY